MADRRKLVFISSIASPHQIKFCEALQKYMDASFWFYEYPDRMRGSFWRIALGAHSRILSPVYFVGSQAHGRYLAPRLVDDLDRHDPDIVMLGGFSIPGNYLAYRWAVRRGKRIIVFTERSRDRRGVLRKRGMIWRMLGWLYRKVDMVMVSADDAVEQFKDEFRFGQKVVAGRYAADLDNYFDHPVRTFRTAYTLLFANRMTEIYNPLMAIEILARIVDRHPESKLLMNAAGELAEDCHRRIKELGLEKSVEFLTDLKSWADLGAVYSRSDILLLPASFSNGNYTILEAMASGLGLVVSDRVLGIGKMVIEGRNGFNCEPTVDAFVERIERYFATPELLRRHAELNRPMVMPLSVNGTAAFFAELLEDWESGANLSNELDRVQKPQAGE